MMFMAMLHSAPWWPNYQEAEQAEHQDKMNELRHATASTEVVDMGGRIMFFERATREILDKPRPRVIGEKPKITLPRLKFMERPMPPWDEPTPRKPVRRKMLPRPR
jgi:hypothetical protein